MTELERKWCKEVEAANSNLEIPLLGAIYTPICAICKNSDFHCGSLDDPECKALNSEIPNEYLACRIYKCPHFIHNPDSEANGVWFDTNLNPIMPKG